jgi:beta-N-acetylhexosaminidase
MPAHVIYPEVDELAAGYSRRWLQDILRNELQFQGVIFSDDLSMEAASPGGSFLQRANQALRAGCDMVLVCNHPEGAAEVLHGLGEYNSPASSLRLVRMHGQASMLYEQLHGNKEWQLAVQKIKPLAETPYLELDV